MQLKSRTVSAWNGHSGIARFFLLGCMLLASNAFGAERQVIGEVTFVQGVATAQSPGATPRFLQKGEPLWHLERVRFAGERPAALQASYLPCALFPELPRQPLEKRGDRHAARRDGLSPADHDSKPRRRIHAIDELVFSRTLLELACCTM
mgnify:CR=1 FL=1